MSKKNQLSLYFSGNIGTLIGKGNITAEIPLFFEISDLAPVCIEEFLSETPSTTGRSEEDLFSE